MRIAVPISKLLILLACWLLIGSSSGYSRNISRLNGDANANRPLTEVLEEISEKFQVFFTYDVELLKDIQVEFDLSDMDDFEEAVNTLLTTTGLAFEHLGGKYYVIYQEDKKGLKKMKKMKRKIRQIQKLENSGSLSLQRHSQNQPVKDLETIARTARQLKASKQLSGTVKDAQGNPLIGANILIKDGRTGTITDVDGRYDLDVPTSAQVLIFSYIGYLPQEVIRKMLVLLSWMFLLQLTN